MEGCRKKGYAHLLTERMCTEILALGKQPVWAHAEQNTGSMKTALSCGFLPVKTNIVIRPE